MTLDDAAEWIEVLNEALALDPAAMHVLVANRVPCNRALMDHPAIVVNVRNDRGDFPTVGLLGILNGIAARGGFRVVAEFDNNTHNIVRFSTITTANSETKPA